ncbi:MAG: asparagine synthase (glutamine-hydrolyzing) [Candidatus Methylumidiphilus sp.]
MCGIAGLFLKSQPVDADRLAALTRRLGHRGPDRVKTHIDGPLGLGHARLSIIDLAGGDQPLFAENGDLALVANGEIYNYVELREDLEARGAVFSTHSDCETILHAYRHYGEGFLAKLHGMFAFALYDKPAGRLLLARDRLGIKPLFFAQTPDGLCFASEQKALFPLLPGGPTVNPAALVQTLETSFNTGANTIVLGIARLQAGEVAEFTAGQLSARRRYWSPFALPAVPDSYDEAAEVFEALMAQVMLEHMRADVPFALFLSGGIDSSVVLEWLRREGAHALAAFTVTFTDAANQDDLDAAKTIALRFGLRHHIVELDRQALFKHLPFAVWAADDLVIDHAILPTSLLAREAARDFKVVFSGEGGDEGFAGYGRYRRTKAQRWLANLRTPGSGGFRTRGQLGGWRGKLFGPLLRVHTAAARQGFIDAWQAAPTGWSDLQRMQHTDIATELADQLLVKVDRLLMAWGLEGRVPLLDHRLIEFALALPDGLKVRGREGKHFLKRWAEPVYGEALTRRPKRGFSVPVGACLSGDNLRKLRQVLPRHPALAGWFEPQGIAAAIDRQAAQADAHDLLWPLLQFAVWHQLFITGGGGRPDLSADPIDFISA